MKKILPAPCQTRSKSAATRFLDNIFKDNAADPALKHIFKIPLKRVAEMMNAWDDVHNHEALAQIGATVTMPPSYYGPVIPL